MKYFPIIFLDYPIINQDMRKKCQKCNLEFECKESPSCWCFKEKGIRKEEIQFNNCVCKKCLQIQYKERILGI